MPKNVWKFVIFIASNVFISVVINPITQYFTDGNFHFTFSTTNILITIGVTLPLAISAYLIWQYVERKRFSENFAFFGKTKKIRTYVFGANGLFPHKYYLKRGINDEIEAGLKSGKNLLILGRPFGGKTRAAFEAMMQMKGWYIAIVGVNGLSISYLQKPLSVRKVILFVDDLNKFEPTSLDFDGVRNKFGRDKSLVIATCREGTEYISIDEKEQFGDFIRRCTSFKILDVTPEEGKTIAENVGKKKLDEFDGTAGSAAENIVEMRKIYRDLPPESVDILHTLRVFFKAGIFNVKRDYLYDLHQEIYGYNTGETASNDLIRELEDNGFVREAEGGYRAKHDIYFEEHFQKRFTNNKLDSYIIKLEKFAIEKWEDAEVLSSLGYFYNLSIKYDKAIEMYISALKIQEEKLGKDHPSVATTLNNLASLYQSQGRYNKAEPLYLRCHKIAEKTLGRDHPNVATMINNLAGLYESQGRYDKAKPMYKRALKIQEEKLDDDHSDVALTLNNLAELYLSLGRYDEAEPLYIRALKIQEEKLGKDHTDVATTLNNLAGLYESQGKFNEAEPLYKPALEIYEKILGSDHPWVAITLNNLAGLYESQGKYDEAEPLYLRALEIQEEKLGKDHPSVAATLNNLAELYRSQYRYDEAEPLYKQALEIYEKFLGSDHPWVAATLNNVGLLYDSTNRKDKAIEYLKKALTIWQNSLPENHPNIISALQSLSAIYSETGDNEKAAEYFLRAEELKRSRGEGE